MITVLIVDDELRVARIHADIVAAQPGFSVVGMAHTASAACHAAGVHQPDLVLLDVHLPDGNGLDVLRRMRDQAPRLHAIVITAAREQGTISHALRAGVTSYLMKPFGRDDLVSRLELFRTQVHDADGANVADQALADRLFPAPRPVIDSNRGVSEETLRAVRDALAASGADLSAQETAERVGVSRVSARRYLEVLHERGEAEVRLRYGAGRPERRYRLVR